MRQESKQQIVEIFGISSMTVNLLCRDVTNTDSEEYTAFEKEFREQIKIFKLPKKNQNDINPLTQPLGDYTALTEEFYFFYKTLQPGGFFRKQYEKSINWKYDYKPRREYKQEVEKLKKFIKKTQIQKITFDSDSIFNEDHKLEIENKYIIEYIIRFIKGVKLAPYKLIKGESDPVPITTELAKGDKQQSI